jgi:hypothetical protein
VDIIKNRIPPNLFDAVSEMTFTSHLELLDKLCALDGPTSKQASQYLFESNRNLQPNQSLREYFQEMKRLIRLAFPSHSPSEVCSVAWTKLLHALPPTLRQSVLLSSNGKYSEKTLDLLDEMWRAVPSSTSTICHSETNLNERLSNIEKHLTALSMAQSETRSPINAAVHRPSKDYSCNAYLCWFHQKFSQRARRCSPHCHLYRRNSGNGEGAPSPKSGLNHYSQQPSSQYRPSLKPKNSDF